MKDALKRQAAPAADEGNTALIAGAVESFARARCPRVPFRHWLFTDALPKAVCREIIALPLSPVRVGETHGKRDSHNEARRFFSPPMQREFSVMRRMAEAFQSQPIVHAIETMCGISLDGSYLRIEYCQDSDGFWLEPHMDIKEKYITIQIYLNTDKDADTLGTDMYDGHKRFHSRAPGALGEGMAFLPKEPESWHGFEKRPIAGIRRSLIVNYVTDEWRARHELAFPESPIAC